MPRGRKPAPPKLRVLKANEGRESGPFAGLRAAGAPAKPETIADDPVASAIWDRTASLLQDRSILSPADEGILVSYCSVYAQLIEVRAALRGQPLTVVNEESGAMKAHPLLGVKSGLERSLYTFASALGLTPTDRGRVTTIEDVSGGQTPLERLNARAAEARSRYVRPAADEG